MIIHKNEVPQWTGYKSANIGNKRKKKEPTTNRKEVEETL